MKTLLATYRNSITLILSGLSLVNFVKLIGYEVNTSMKDGFYLMIVGVICGVLIFLIFKKYQEIKICKPNITILIVVLLQDYLFIKEIYHGDHKYTSLIMIISIITLIFLNLSIVFELEE